MVLVGVGTFFAQAVATGFVSRAATGDRGAASGMYLSSYFAGGLVGTALLGQAFDRFGWAACVAGIASVARCSRIPDLPPDLRSSTRATLREAAVSSRLAEVQAARTAARHATDELAA